MTTLTWNGENDWDTAYVRQHKGLTLTEKSRFSNEGLGMITDVSHLNKPVF
jgi:microsomal dipeptidase-like Zn-dependent dipeptidase